MKVIGITGGIGTGKSFVSAIFAKMGIPVYDSDAESKKLSNTSNVIKNGLINEFGKEVYIDNELNKPFLASLIFGNDENRKKVNSIIHPEVKKHFESWVAQQHNVPYVLKETAILFESGAYKQVQKSIVVAAPIALRVSRVMERDGLSETEIMKRVNSQMADEKRIELSDFVIHNNETQMLLPQIVEIDKTLKEM